MKTYSKPSVHTEHFVLLQLMQTSAAEPRVKGGVVSGGQNPLDYLKHEIL